MNAPSPNPTPIPARARAALGRVPTGTVELGRRYLVEAQRCLSQLDDAKAVDHRLETVEAHIVRPLLLTDDWPDPTNPLPVGDGAVHADLIDDDLDALARLRSTIEGWPDPERLAREAQRWRLPVTPYRRRQMATAGGADVTGALRAKGRRRRSLRGCVIVDLSALWAGPLATKLLADQGVEVIKVDPSPRPDAFGVHHRLYQHLNASKDIIDLDLRVPVHRERFEALLGQADLVVDSFSRRVMPNLGYSHAELKRINPRLSTLSIVAFPQGSPEADWLSYGPGVHAASGLADANPANGNVSGATFRSAPIAYPDALAGLNAFAVAVDALTNACARSAAGVAYEVSLSSSIEPLLAHPMDGDTVGGP